MHLGPPVITDTVSAVTNPLPKEIASFGAVHLDVTDLPRSVAFWTEVIGLHLRSEEADQVHLGTTTETLVVLYPGAGHAFLPRHSGLYHLAIHPPNEAEFARILRNLTRARWRFSPVDHIMSKAIYLNDPDGITVEITLETPERLRELVLTEHAVEATRIDGSRASGRDPFDVQTVLAALPSTDAGTLVPIGTKIGHVHLHVGDLLDSYQFYRGLGFSQALWAPDLGVGDLGAGGAFNHRIAVNTWQGRNAPQAPVGTARMRHFSIRLDTPERLDDILGNLEQDTTETHAGYQISDPAGNTIALSTQREPAM